MGYVVWEVGGGELAVVGTAPGEDFARCGESADGGPGGGDAVDFRGDG